MVKNIQNELMKITEHWSPVQIGLVNDFAVKVVKIKGEFVDHFHETEDEMFIVIKGTMVMRYEDESVELIEGDTHVVEKGRVHCPIAAEECHIMLLEKDTTKQYGNKQE